MNKNKHNKKILLIIALTVVLFASGAGALYLWKKDKIAPSADNPVTQENTSVKDKNQPIINAPSGSEDKVITPTPTPESESSLEKPNITRAEQSGDYIRVSAIFSNASSGTCLLRLEKAGAQTITKTAEIIVGASYYTCNGFRIPRSELAAPGEWTATIIHQNNNQIEESDKKIINVQ
jgi:hypothetical protein